MAAAKPRHIAASAPATERGSRERATGQAAGSGNPTRSSPEQAGGAMRIRNRKRTPARAASPPPPPLPLQQQPEEKPREEEEEEDKEAEEEEEKRAILAAGVRDGGGDDDRVRPAAAAASGNRRSSSSATDDVPKPEPEDDVDAAAAGNVRCSRNDGKRWRCKKAAVPGYLLCDRHIAWSTRKRKAKATSNSKPKSHGSGVLKPTTVTVTIPKDFAEEDHHGETQQQHIEHNARV